MSKTNNHAVSETPADAYLCRWRLDSRPPDLAAFLDAWPDLSSRDLVDVLLVDQQIRSERQAWPPTEEYLREFPQIAEDPRLVADLVYGQWRAAGKEERPRPSAALAEQVPDLVRQLEHQSDVWDWLCQTADESDGRTRANPHVARRVSNAALDGGRGKAICVALGIGAIAAAIFAIVGAWRHFPSPRDGEQFLVESPPAVPPLHHPVPYEVAWTLDAFRRGDLDRQDRLTAAPGPVYAGDALRMAVKLNRAAYAYAFMIDPAGEVALVGTQSNLPSTETPLAFPDREEQAIVVPNQTGTMLCVVVVRDQPLADAASVAQRLRPPQPLPALDADTLLIDGAPLTAQPQQPPAAADGVQLAQVLSRLGDGHGSRAVGPSQPLADRPLAEALADWYERLPDDLGDVHYLALPVVGTSP